MAEKVTSDKLKLPYSRDDDDASNDDNCKDSDECQGKSFTDENKTFEKYLQEREQRIEKQKKKFVEKFRKILTNKPYNYDRETATEFANDLLNPDTKFDLNAAPLAFEDTELGRLRKEWYATVNETMMLLRFPRQSNQKSLEQDDDSRMVENERYVELCNTAHTSISHQRIDSREDLFHSLCHFLRNCTTKLATVVFNGHGTRQGLCVHQGGPVPLNDIITKVRDYSRHIEPDAIDILFGQCYGHVHNHDENPLEIVYIKSLTNNEKPFTVASVRTLQLRDVTQANHYDLNCEAREHRRPQRAEPEPLNLREDEGQYQQVEQTGQSMNAGHTSGFGSMRRSGRHADPGSFQAPGVLFSLEDSIQALTESTGNLQLAANQGNRPSSPALTVDSAVSSLSQPPVVDGSEASNSQLPALQSLLQPDEDLDNV